MPASPDAFLDRVSRLGTIVGEMHCVLAADVEDAAFAPEEPTPETLGLLTATIEEQIDAAYAVLPDDDSMTGIVGRAEELREITRKLAPTALGGHLIRTHGDLHLGQVLWFEDDWYITDFEGEPARSIADRRRKMIPLRDVAGMLRSFAYLVATLDGQGTAAPEGFEDEARARFLAAYREAVQRTGLLPSGEGAQERLIELFELEKVLYELRYELAHRPDWVAVPVAGHRPLPGPSRAVTGGAELERLLSGQHSDPHSVLGAHVHRDGIVVRTLRPGAATVAATSCEQRVELTEIRPGLFEGVFADTAFPFTYQLEIEYPGHPPVVVADAYSFAPTLGPLDLHLLGEGRHFELHHALGARPLTVDDVGGVAYAVWAPSARAVSVTGDFDVWNERAHPMRSLGVERRVGAVRARVEGGRPLQVLGLARRRQRASPQGGSRRARRRGAPAHRVGRRRQHLRVERRGVDGPPRRVAPVERTGVDLRGASRLLAARPRLRRARAPVGRLRERPRLHPRRAHAGDGASVRGVMGIPGHRVSSRPRPASAARMRCGR